MARNLDLETARDELDTAAGSVNAALGILPAGDKLIPRLVQLRDELHGIAAQVDERTQPGESDAELDRNAGDTQAAERYPECPACRLGLAAPGPPYPEHVRGCPDAPQPGSTRGPDGDRHAGDPSAQL